MLQVISGFTLTQVPTKAFPNRTSVYSFDFANEIEVFTSWKNITDTATIKFPKNIYIYDSSTGKSTSLEGQNITSGSTGTPFVLRGDQVSITVGYIADSNAAPVTNVIFNGYVAEINNKMPIELKCEDNMFALKQLQATGSTNGIYNDPATAKTMLTDLLSKTNFTVNDNQMNMSLGSFTIKNESVAQVIDRLRKNYKLECYFRGNELRASMIAYYYGDATNYTLNFQYNVISDSLEYKRAAETNIAVTAYSYLEQDDEDSANLYGDTKTTVQRIEYTAQSQPNSDIEIGENQVIYFPNTSMNDLQVCAKARLNRINVDGWIGKVTTFGLPYIKHGDSVTLVDTVLPERAGTYMVKSVKTTMSLSGGLRQEVELDMRIDNLSPSEIALGL